MAASDLLVHQPAFASDRPPLYWQRSLIPSKRRWNRLYFLARLRLSYASVHTKPNLNRTAPLGSALPEEDHDNLALALSESEKDAQRRMSMTMYTIDQT